MYRHLFYILLLGFSFSAIANDDHSEQHRQQAIELSEVYFKNILTGEYEMAYAATADSLRVYIPKSKFISNKKAFRAAAIEPIKIRISRVTVYQNPANAPKPGTYVAADYNNEFSGLPIHCGYLVWFKANNDDIFRIVREESGHITSIQFEEIKKKGQLASIKERLQCVP